MKPKIKSMDLEKLLGKWFVSEKHQVNFIIRIAKQPYTFEGLQEIQVSSNDFDFYNLSDGTIK